MEGYEVKVAKSATKVLRLAGVPAGPRAARPDAPRDLSGTQVLERIRSDHGSDPKVLVSAPW